MWGRTLIAAGICGALALALAVSAQAAPQQRSYAVVNDGVYTVTSLQVRVGVGWTDNLLDRPVEPGETRQVKLPDDGRPCLVDLAVNSAARSMDAFLFDENVCARPEFHVKDHLDPQDAPGNGRGRRTGSVRGAPAELERGVPLCPADARCRRKPGG